MGSLGQDSFLVIAKVTFRILNKLTLNMSQLFSSSLKYE